MLLKIGLYCSLIAEDYSTRDLRERDLDGGLRKYRNLFYDNSIYSIHGDILIGKVISPDMDWLRFEGETLEMCLELYRTYVGNLPSIFISVGLEGIIRNGFPDAGLVNKEHIFNIPGNCGAAYVNLSWASVDCSYEDEDGVYYDGDSALYLYSADHLVFTQVNFLPAIKENPPYNTLKKLFWDYFTYLFSFHRDKNMLIGTDSEEESKWQYVIDSLGLEIREDYSISCSVYNWNSGHMNRTYTFNRDNLKKKLDLFNQKRKKNA